MDEKLGYRWRVFPEEGTWVAGNTTMTTTTVVLTVRRGLQILLVNQGSGAFTAVTLVSVNDVLNALLVADINGGFVGMVW